MSRITIILPAFNEAKAIGPVLHALRSLPLDAEIVVVDDGSQDETAQIAEGVGARVIRHPINMGYGHTIKTAIRAATTDIVVLTDADGTYPIESIPVLVAAVEKGVHMAVGARQGKIYQGSVFRKIARWVFRTIAELSAGKTIPDINSGFRAFRVTDITPYLDDLCNGFSFTTTITLVYLFTGKIVQFFPIEYRPRVGSSNVHLVRDSLRTLQYIFQVTARYNPVKLFLFLAILPLLWSCIFLYWMGPPALLLGGLAALIIFAMSVLAETQRGG